MSNSRAVVSLPLPASDFESGLNPQSGPQDHPVIVVGNGPIGIRCVEEIRRNLPNAQIVIFGDESDAPYNRVQLSALLSGEVSESEILNPPKTLDSSGITRQQGCRILSIDRQLKFVTDEHGHQHRYSRLVLATGSIPRCIPVEGIGLAGVSTFRKLADVRHLLGRCRSGDRFVVIGGGLLGLETAWGINRRGATVTVVEFADQLLSRQLDQPGARSLREQIEFAGIVIHTGTHVTKIIGDARVRALLLNNGLKIACESVVIAAGVEPNIELASAAGITTNTGIVVDDSMRTSDSSIYAAGECVEHRGRVYGLVAPGFEQAKVLGRALQSKHSGRQLLYHGSNEASYLKVAGNAVFSATPSLSSTDSLNTRSFAYRNQREAIYRRIFIQNNSLTGAIGIGPWQETARIRHAIDEGQQISTLDILRFRITGEIWQDCSALTLEMTSNKIVCQCMSVSKGTIQASIDAGASCVSQIAQSTGASTVCGSCKPQLEILMGSALDTGLSRQQILFRALIAVVLLGFGLTTVLPPVPLALSFENPPWWDSLWRESFNRQLSGFALLFITLAAATIGMRKRVAFLRRFGEFSGWRTVHLLLGVGFIACLAVHTGLRFGHGLDRLLFLNFAVALVAGIVASIGFDRHLQSPSGVSHRRQQQLNFIHLAAIWPIPVVLGWHIFKCYWY